jgi:hypothetical protein
MAGAQNVLAAFQDGVAFLARQTLGRGEFYFCSSLPESEWSTLGDGPVLVPMIQRLLQSGSRRLNQAAIFTCGELSLADQARQWEALDSPKPRQIATDAGVYRSGERLLAINRPTEEDDPETLDSGTVRQLFGPVALQLLQDRSGDVRNLQGEVWRVFLFGMLIFLVVEAALILPPRAAAPVGSEGERSGTPMRHEAEAVS